ncbi:hypothetical protein LFL96_14545 [Paraburkholderia sp. D15]|uniref:antiviral RADAR system adenosine triphosphatase RdrA n=1 Tax=Paraburkholderia sp. D15 TaxID=2880218 RepID=UPI00247B22FA|nr:antiviral RADAR system adenosine triphosphatase RdrA [Paraburkholderia sp. D15]WGS48981.1 hypothetical protein LFL96_14545 [Paraburkholderia sp. D15]
MSQFILLPVSQEEQALQSAQSLLPRTVYKQIQRLLEEHVQRMLVREGNGKPRTLDEVRAHEAILIAGSRGTGKSSVLVNLETYLAKEAAVLRDQLLILKPVDPTLLDNDHDLLLNVIVAAIIRNEKVKTLLDVGDPQAQRFYEKLHELGAALEAVQTRSEKYGLERLRSFMGNHGLAQKIHELFREALLLTGKQVIVLPIDDVDTSLNHAFENLEIVRKYLASPYVLPIISGDLKLYHEVIWREMHGRILKDSTAERHQAVRYAQSLAQEYQIKVLPLPRRLTMPEIDDYLRDENIVLVKPASNAQAEPTRLMTLPQYSSWIEAFLNERVNGVENSRLALPVRTLRVLTQLIFSTRSEIPALFELQRDAEVEEERDIRRLLFMSRAFAGDRITATIREWALLLRNAFRHQHDAGNAFLVLDAWLEWLKMNLQAPNEESHSLASVTRSVLDLPLFKPMVQPTATYDHFDRKHPLRDEWLSQIAADQAPEPWLARFPEHAILAYPMPELGRRMSALGAPVSTIQTESDTAAEFLRQVMIHRNFYSRSTRSAMVFCGRLFELVVSSLVRDISRAEISRILAEHPYHSLTALANTKALTLTSENEDNEESVEMHEANREAASILDTEMVYELIDSINSWRRIHRLTAPHPWLLYNVMNKFFNQVNIFNSRQSGNNVSGSMLDMSRSALKAFYALWATIGSFEKGPLFGFDNRIAYQNVGRVEGFRNSLLYNFNILPFMALDIEYGSVTKALGSHPLLYLIENVHKATTSRRIFHRRTYDHNKALDLQVPTSLDLARRLIGSEDTRETILAMSRADAIRNLRQFKQQFSAHGLSEDWALLVEASAFDVGFRGALAKIVQIMRRAKARPHSRRG